MNATINVSGACLMVVNLALASLSIRVASSEALKFSSVPVNTEMLPSPSPLAQGVERAADPELRRLFAPAPPSSLRKVDAPQAHMPQEQLALRLVGIMSMADRKVERVAVVEYGSSRRIARLRTGEAIPGTDVTVTEVTQGAIELRQGSIYRTIKLD